MYIVEKRVNDTYKKVFKGLLFECQDYVMQNKIRRAVIAKA